LLQVSNDPAGFATLIERFSMLHPELIVVEASGGYEIALIGELVDAELPATPHEVETFIANVAGQDNRNVPVVLQREPGSGSALWIDSMRRGVLLGYSVYADQVKGTKFERSQPFRAAAEAGKPEAAARSMERRFSTRVRAVQCRRA
jgi:hypothetical protein